MCRSGWLRKRKRSCDNRFRYRRLSNRLLRLLTDRIKTRRGRGVVHHRHGGTRQVHCWRREGHGVGRLDRIRRRRRRKGGGDDRRRGWRRGGASRRVLNQRGLGNHGRRLALLGGQKRRVGRRHALALIRQAVLANGSQARWNADARLRGNVHAVGGHGLVCLLDRSNLNGVHREWDLVRAIHDGHGLGSGDLRVHGSSHLLGDIV